MDLVFASGVLYYNLLCLSPAFLPSFLPSFLSLDFNSPLLFLVHYIGSRNVTRLSLPAPTICRVGIYQYDPQSRTPLDSSRFHTTTA
ncbi:hypothetical protein DL93DRAFT_936659 [Clavulina sp. PMI_390]|nr:hypothetical protein DL93DRAFT_936659 [Clavulina sp. PMI_390]